MEFLKKNAVKNRDVIYVLIISLIAIYPIALALNDNWRYLIVLCAFIVWSILKKSETKHLLILSLFYIALHSSLYLVFKEFIFFDISFQPSADGEKDLVRFIVIVLTVIIMSVLFKKKVQALLVLLLLVAFITSSVFSFMEVCSWFVIFRYYLIFTLLFIPFMYIYPVFFTIVKYSTDERKLLAKYHSFSDIVCSKHLIRAKVNNKYGYKTVTCAKENCQNEELLIRAKNIVGLIGANNEFSYKDGNNYYLNIFDEFDQIIDADYDIVEIRNTAMYVDNNSIITEMVSYFYNAINRRKPIDKMVVKIVGKPDLSKNTIRLLEERFLEVIEIPQEK